MELKFTNSLTKKKELFTPLKPQQVSMYVCGITPYDYSHIGHGRSYVNFDILHRLLKHLGYTVTYVRNFTDIDDKIINRAAALGGGATYQTIADKFIAAYHEDMAALNCQPPTHEPRVTECIPEIIDFVQELIKKNKAYIVDGDVYFDIASFPAYGKLSGRTGDDLLAGARVEVDARKKNPGDFALWKGNNEQQYWHSPWGYGRPGWHIECSVMINKLLGSTIDIHGGGADLVFPHHENELTQSESLHNHPLAHVWLHNAFITINKEKMSKSLGNFVTLKDLFKHFDPMVLRFFVVQHHYRTPIDFSDAELQAAQTAYKKLVAAFAAMVTSSPSDSSTPQPLVGELVAALCDDLNTSKFLGLLFENLTTIKQDPALFTAVRQLITDVLGLTLTPLPEKKVELTPEIQTLIEQREQARKDKNWTLADQLRAQLLELGYQVQDKKK